MSIPHKSLEESKQLLPKKRGPIDHFFKLTERGTDIKTELIAGLTTFMAISYIVIVIPSILSEAGIPTEAALAATIYVSVFCTIVFAFWSNFPAAVAPGIGLVSFFTYTVVIGQGLTWQTALGAVFISGICFTILTITGIRKKIIDAIPESMKSAITVGIGLFISFLEFKNAGIIVANEATIVSIGNLANPGVLLACFGLIAAAYFTAKNVKGGLLYAILATTALSMIIGYEKIPASFNDVVSFQLPSLSETFMAMDIKSAIGYGILTIIFSFTIVELFDNTATLIGLAKKGGLVDKEGNIEKIDRALQADAIGTMLSATMGGTALNAYAENATGVAAGGRTGLKAIFVALFLALTLIFAPLISFIPAFATAPILILVGAFMISEIRNISFDDFTTVVPVFLTIILMPLTFSIAEGLAFGFVSFTLLKLLTRKRDELHWMMYIISLAFALHFASKFM